MTEESREVQEIQEDQDLQKIAEAQEAQEAPEAQEVQDDESQMPEQERPGVPPCDQDGTPTVESVVEAVLFASDEPLTEARLANIIETSAQQFLEPVIIRA